MRSDLVSRIQTTTPIQILTAGDLGVFVCAIGFLLVMLLSPQFSDDPLPNFEPMETTVRKAEFFTFLGPILSEVNVDVRTQRQFLTDLSVQVEAGDAPSWLAGRRLKRIAEYYEVDSDDGAIATAVLPELLQRVDIVPRSLVFVQAAKESGWGTSRFAREGNNLFGQRCYSAGCGIAPTGVQPSARFAVAQFGSVKASVASYVRNLNTHPQYEGFRRLRKTLRDSDRNLTGIVLADSLLDYSERGEAYVSEIKAMIRQNSLEEYDLPEG
jgi:Bax protein